MRLIFPTASGAGIGTPELADLYAYPPAPWVRANFVSSADGAASVNGRSRGLSSEADRRLFALLRTLCDVIMVGAGTVRAEHYGAVRPDEMTPGLREGRTPVPPIAVVTRRLSLDLSSRLFTAAQPGARTIVITTEQAPAELRASAQLVADVIIAGAESCELPVVLSALAERGYPRVLAEGGPHMLTELAEQEVLDELDLTLSPLLALGGAGRITTAVGPGSPAPLRLAHVLEDDDHLFCRYTRAGR